MENHNVELTSRMQFVLSVALLITGKYSQVMGTYSVEEIYKWTFNALAFFSIILVIIINFPKAFPVFTKRMKQVFKRRKDEQD